MLKRQISFHVYENFNFFSKPCKQQCSHHTAHTMSNQAEPFNVESLKRLDDSLELFTQRVVEINRMRRFAESQKIKTQNRISLKETLFPKVIIHFLIGLKSMETNNPAIGTNI